MTPFKYKTLQLIVIVILISGLNTYSQSMDTLGFWNHSVKPIIDKDFKAMEDIIQFPLEGEWGFLMQLDKPEKEWTKEDFFANYNVFFTDSIIDRMRKAQFTNIDIFNNEILIGIEGENKSKAEFGLIFRFKFIENIWKLTAIQGVG